MIAGRIVPAVIISNIALPGSATIRITPRTRIRSVAGIGVCVCGLTRPMIWWAGKRESRDIAKTMRRTGHDRHHAGAEEGERDGQQQQSLHDRTQLVAQDLRDRRGAGADPGMSRIAMVSAMSSIKPSPPAAATDPTIARGTLRNGSLASSARLAAASKPTSVPSPMIIASINPPPMPK